MKGAPSDEEISRREEALLLEATERSFELERLETRNAKLPKQRMLSARMRPGPRRRSTAGWPRLARILLAGTT